MGKSTISMAIFNSYVKLPEGIEDFPSHKSSLSGLFPSLAAMDSDPLASAQVVGRQCLPCTGTVERVNAWHKLPLVYVLQPDICHEHGWFYMGVS